MATGRLPDPNTAPLTAKGDLYTYSTVPAKLAVGSNGDTLVADSSTSTGLRWQAPVAVNPFINGGFDIWQRGTSVAFGAVGGFGADRNIIVRTGWAGGATMSRQTGTAGIQYAARIQRDAGNTSTASTAIGHSVETANAVFYQGKTVTVSFYARAGANFSGASNTINFQLQTGTGTDQNLITTGYTGLAQPIDVNPTLTTSWQRFQYTATLASNVNEFGYYINYTPSGTAGANDWFEVTGIQLEVGSVATPFRRSGGTLAGELAACQRYYERITRPSADQPIGLVSYYNTTNCYATVPYKVTKRVTPTTFNASGTGIFTVYSNGAGRVSTNVVSDQVGDNFMSINITTAAATGGNVGVAYFTTASSWIEVSAEL